MKTLRALSATALLFAALCACSTPSPQAPLYQQLGGPAAIEGVVSRVIDRMVQDPRTARSFKGVKLATLKKSIAAHLCVVADGPCVYEGETMAKAHSQSHNTAAEFDLMVQALREELDAAGVSTAAKNELLRRLAPMRRDIVTAS